MSIEKNDDLLEIESRHGHRGYTFKPCLWCGKSAEQHERLSSHEDFLNDMNEARQTRRLMGK